MSDLQPLILHRMGGTSNPWQVTIILEELGLPYKVEEHAPANMPELKQKPFTNLDPNGRVPMLIDPKQDNITLWEASKAYYRSRGIRLTIDGRVRSSPI